MRLSERLKRIPDNGCSVETIEQAKALEALAEAVANIGVDSGFGEFYLDDTHIEKARKLLA